MITIPLYIKLVFGATTLLTVFIFYKSARHSNFILFILIAWLALQSAIGLSGFYKVLDTMPPRFLLLVLPPLITILFLFVTGGGRKFLDSLDAGTLILLHIIRIPVEFVLYWLFISKAVPQLMTFEGRNFDILSGLTAPFIYYFGYVKKQLGKKVILFWNIVCIALLVNIVANAILSLPVPFQKFAFDQPNVAVLYFPFLWLPCCVVPLVLLSHLASIRQLMKPEP